MRVQEIKWSDVRIFLAVVRSGIPRVWEQLELNRPTCFLLHDDSTRSNPAAADKVADIHLDEVAATKFAIDRKVKSARSRKRRR